MWLWHTYHYLGAVNRCGNTGHFRLFTCISTAIQGDDKKIRFTDEIKVCNRSLLAHLLIRDCNTGLVLFFSSRSYTKVNILTSFLIHSCSRTTNRATQNTMNSAYTPSPLSSVSLPPPSRRLWPTTSSYSPKKTQLLAANLLTSPAPGSVNITPLLHTPVTARLRTSSSLAVDEVEKADRMWTKNKHLTYLSSLYVLDLL